MQQKANSDKVLFVGSCFSEWKAISVVFWCSLPFLSSGPFLRAVRSGEQRSHYERPGSRDRDHVRRHGGRPEGIGWVLLCLVHGQSIDPLNRPPFAFSDKRWSTLLKCSEHSALVEDSLKITLIKGTVRERECEWYHPLFKKVSSLARKLSAQSVILILYFWKYKTNLVWNFVIPK